MNTNQYLRLFLTVVVLFIPFCAGQGLCQTMNGLPRPVKLITVRATIKNSAGKPLMGVALTARNQSGSVVEEPDYDLIISGATGQTYTRLPVASGFYFVSVQTHGYVPPPSTKNFCLSGCKLDVCAEAVAESN